MAQRTTSRLHAIDCRCNRCRTRSRQTTVLTGILMIAVAALVGTGILLLIFP